MEKDTKNNQMIQNTIRIISIMSELHMPISYFHYNLPKGLCLVAEDPEYTDDLLCAFNRINDFHILHSPQITNSDLPNYKFAIYEPHRNDKLDILNNFLTAPRFLTALLVSGVIPDNLPNSYIIVIPSGSISDKDTQILNAEICYFKNFIRDRPEILEEELKKFNTEDDFFNRPINSPLYVQMLLAAKMYKICYRSKYSESETALRYNNILTSLERIFDFSENFLENTDLSDIVINLFLRYIENHNEIFYSPPDKVEARIYKHVSEGNVIFFDDSFYFVAEKLLKKICDPLLESFSWIYIKENLRQAEILYCNRCQPINYTRKKLLITEYGIETRNRFLWLRKEVFVSWDRLSPEERSKTNEEFLSGQAGTRSLPDFGKRPQFFHHHQWD